MPALVDYGTSSGAGFSCVFAGACCDSADAEMIRGLERKAAPRSPRSHRRIYPKSLAGLRIPAFAGAQ